MNYYTNQLNNNYLNTLLIDDEETCVITAKILLKESRFKLIVAKNGKEALKILETHKIDNILLDLMLPDIDGLELLNIIKNNDHLKKIPVVLQTGSSNWEDIKKAKDFGISSFIRKPYKKEVLLKSLNTDN